MNKLNKYKKQLKKNLKKKSQNKPISIELKRL